MSTVTVTPDVRELSIKEMVRLLMPANHERRGRHVSLTDDNPTSVVETIQRGRGKHRAEPIGFAAYLENTSSPRHRAQPASLFELVNNN